MLCQVAEPRTVFPAQRVGYVVKHLWGKSASKGVGKGVGYALGLPRPLALFAESVAGADCR